MSKPQDVVVLVPQAGVLRVDHADADADAGVRVPGAHPGALGLGDAARAQHVLAAGEARVRR